MPVARSHWITPVLFAFVSLLAPSVVSAQTEAASKTTEEVFEHQALKARIAAHLATPAEIDRAVETGLRFTHPDREMCAVYVARRLDADAIALLGRRGVFVIPDLFVDRVEGRHPFGFHIAEVTYAALASLEFDPNVRRIASLEHDLKPNMDPARAMVKADMVQNGVGVTTRTGRGVKVAVADSGLDLTHPDIPVPFETYDVTDGATVANWSTNVANTIVDHGTHIASIVCGSGGLSFGRYKGIAPEATLCFYKVGNDANAGASEADIIKAINRAVLVGCKAINVAYGGFDATMDGSNSLCQAVDAAFAGGTIVVCSAGNEADKKGHAATTVAPGTTSMPAAPLAYSVGPFFSITPFSAQQQIEVVWRDDNPNDLNITLACTNLAAGETFVLSSSQTTSRGTESRRYVLTTNIAPNLFGMISKTYSFTVTNAAASGQTPLVHGFRSAGLGGSFQTPVGGYTVVYPGLADTAFTIGAVTHRTTWTNYQNQVQFNGLTYGLATPYSSIGPRIDGYLKPDVTAPGDAMIAARDSLFANNALDVIDNDGVNLNGLGPANYYRRNGTSQSCAVAVGAVALLLEASPTLTPAQVVTALKSTASLAATPTNQDGKGILDVRAAILSVDQKPTIRYLSPAFAIAGQGALTVDIVGADFKPASIVRWNGTVIPATYVSAQTLQITLSAALTASLGNAQVTVEQAGGTGGGTSNAYTFSVISRGRLTRGVADDECGAAVAWVGSVDGDGVDDVAVGIPGADVRGIDSGAVRVMSGATGRVIWEITGLTTGDRFGDAIAAVGDLNGDGITEIAIGIPKEDFAGVDAGAVRIVNGATGATIRTLYGLGAGSDFGHSVAGGGDQDGDLIPDMIVGAPQVPINDFGYAAVISGATGNVIRTIAGDNYGDAFGQSVADLGDVNGDGRADFAVGASDPIAGPGYVRIYSGLNGAVLSNFTSVYAPTTFGRAIAAVGDLNFDGTNDLLVTGGSLNGAAAAQAFSGANGANLGVLFAGVTGDDYGVSVAGIGDWNDDGFPDIAFGATQTTGGGAGYVEIYSWFDQRSLVRFNGLANGYAAGRSVGTAGDFDQNGVLDLAYGAAKDATNGTDAGVFVIEPGTAAALYRGSRSDFVMLSAGAFNAPWTSGGGADQKTLHSFDPLILHFESPYHTYDWSQPIVAAQVMTPGLPPVTPIFPELHLSVGGAFIIYGGGGAPIFGPTLLPPGGISIGFSIPPQSVQLNVIVQALVVTSSAPNGFFVTADAHEFVLLP